MIVNAFQYDFSDNDMQAHRSAPIDSPKRHILVVLPDGRADAGPPRLASGARNRQELASGRLIEPHPGRHQREPSPWCELERRRKLRIAEPHETGVRERLHWHDKSVPPSVLGLEDEDLGGLGPVEVIGLVPAAELAQQEVADQSEPGFVERAPYVRRLVDHCAAGVLQDTCPGWPTMFRRVAAGGSRGHHSPSLQDVRGSERSAAGALALSAGLDYDPICWAVQWAVGCSVTLKWTTRRRW